MLLRTIRWSRFRGGPDLPLRELPTGGAHLVALPDGAPAQRLADAVSFALTGATTDGASALGPDAGGAAWVELGFETDAGRASVFRGAAAGGGAQVSLREKDPLRVTSGESAVRQRLRELLGAEPEDVARATVPTWDDGATAGGGAAPTGPEVGADPRSPVDGALEPLVLGLRLASVEERVRALLGELSGLAARLRRARADADAALRRLTEGRERVRARVVALEEYGRTAARGTSEPAPPAPDLADRTALPLAALCACGFASLLVAAVVSTGTVSATHVAALAGAGLSLSAGWAGVAVLRRARSSATRDAGAGAREAVRASLLARFADLKDPDAPGLVETLRRRAARLERDTAPLRARIETLDELIADCDVEEGRAARDLHVPPPPHEAGSSGLHPDETPESLPSRISALGDAAHAGCVERDALLAQGAVRPGPEATAALLDAYAALGRACGDEGSALSDARRALESLGLLRPSASGPVPDPSLAGERLRATAAAIRARTPARAACGARDRTWRNASPFDAAVPPRRSGIGLPEPEPRTAAPAPDAVEDPGGDAVRELTQGRFDALRVDADGSVELSSAATGERRPLAGLDGTDRARLLLGLRLRSGEASLGARGPRSVVLGGTPPGFADGPDLAAFVARHAPRATQVVVGRGGERPRRPAPHSD